MKRNFPSEFVYQVFSLLIAFIIVHAFYVTLGTARPAQNAAIDEGGHEDNFLSARFVRIADDGTITQHLITPSDPWANGDGKAADRR